ncbi:polyprenyl diphosphate synthase [Salinibius halmophilus]|uniref:polyprenyl diphosphate synthase n=1 Tax=Salinibius halmophilus TaxID=1853216 RepID=UPI000E6708FA|nr:polyprenyl diphosphate synthase [Salinibius halmophilus]
MTMEKIPRHIAIIMDGNNRWAKQRLLGGVAGHKASVEAVRAAVRRSAELGVEALTLFAFSSENWKRPQEEVSALMELFIWALEKESKRLAKNNLRLRIIGDRTALSSKINKLADEAERLTANNTGMSINVAVNYGGRWDITQAAKVLAEKVAAGELAASNIDESLLDQHTCLSDLPALDLLIRTAGEQRVSNFLLWQLAYAEFWFCEDLWPDFREHHIDQAVAVFNGRDRRFGSRESQ